MTGTRFLCVLVFVVGAASLGAEIAAARLMAPFFGASTIIWANTIGVVLVALSIGYWLGGRLADRRPEIRSLCLVILAAAVLLALVPLIARPFFDLSVDALDEIEAGAFVGSLAAVLLLVAIPVVLLGTAAPWALRLAVGDVEHAGRVAGRLYAISTVGSLTGTMLSALVLIPFVGTQRTFLVFALALAAVGAAGLGWRFAAVPVAVAAAIALPVGTVKAADDGRILLRGRVRAAVHPGDRGGRRRPRARAQRGPGDPLAPAGARLPDRRLLGQLPGAPVRGPGGGAAQGRGARQRSGHDRALIRALLARGRGRRGRDRSGAERGRLPLLRHGLEPEPDRVRRGRAAVAAPLRRRLRPDRRRRLPPALHPLLHGRPRSSSSSPATGSRPAGW